jgi:putative tryptophan/tyrosine transport system substrate-binding protein
MLLSRHTRRREFIAGLWGAATWPLAVRAQQAAMPVIGYLDFFAPRPREPRDPYLEALRAGLADGGFVEGMNLFIEYRWAGGNFMRLPDLVADLVDRQVAVIVAVGAVAPALSAKAATSTIPIVFFYGGDPVKDHLVASLNRPGGNVTGINAFTGELAGKRLDLLLKVVPQVNKIGFLARPRFSLVYEEQTTAMLAAGRALGVEIMIVECRDDSDYEAAMAKIAEGGAGGMILGSFVLPNLNKVVSLAALHKLPTIYPFRALARAGGLMSYDADILDLTRHVGSAYVARILKGAKPADLPVEQPTKFDLVINLKTARALELEVPSTLVALADEVVE